MLEKLGWIFSLFFNQIIEKIISRLIIIMIYDEVGAETFHLISQLKKKIAIYSFEHFLDIMSN